MPLEEKVYTIPLRKKWVEKPRVARANLCIDNVRLFLSRHLKTDEIKISQLLNESLWAGGAKKPPAFVKVKAVKDEKGIVNAMLPEERLEVTEKKGLRHRLLRRKGDTETKIVKEDKKQESKGAEIPKPDEKAGKEGVKGADAGRQNSAEIKTEEKKKE